MTADTNPKVIRTSWEDWRSRRAAKRSALEKKGLSTPSRRSTARPETRAAVQCRDIVKKDSPHSPTDATGRPNGDAKAGGPRSVTTGFLDAITMSAGQPSGMARSG